MAFCKAMIKPFARLIMGSYFCLRNYFSNRQGIFVLMYHRVNDHLPANHLVVSRQQFCDQMKYLKKYCDVIGIKQFVDIFDGKERLTPKRRPQVVITIDDGYRDNFLNAFPILKEFDLPATIFIATGMIGTNQRMSRYENVPLPDMLNWEEVKIMKENNITFGPHTHSHSRLPELSYTGQKAEIERSIDVLWERLSEDISRKIFCYPYGEYNEDSLKILKELGIKVALTVKSGINSKDDHFLELKRVCVDGSRGFINFMEDLAPAPLPRWLNKYR